SGGRLEEVVVVRGDELAELVDEEAEADAGDERRRPTGAATEQGEQDRDRDHHQKAPPEQVGDVEAVAAELRVVGEPELGADAEDRRHRGDEEGLVEEAEVGVAAGAAEGAEAGAHVAVLSPASSSTRFAAEWPRA